MNIEAQIEIVHNLLLAGQLTAIVFRDDSPKEIKRIAKLIDPDVLQGFLDSKPETDGFIYTEQVQQAIRLARTFKSFGKG